MVPDDDHAIVLPWASVIVIIVLLNDAFTWATREAMFLRPGRGTRAASLPILDPFAARHCEPDQLLLLAGDRLGRALAGPGVGMGALTTNRQAAAMTQPTIASEVHQTFDVHGGFAPQIALDHIVVVDHFADLQDLLVGELRHPPLVRNPRLGHDLPGLGRPDAVDILEPDEDPFVGWNVNTSDTGQSRHS